jgi:hypothetical protein
VVSLEGDNLVVFYYFIAFETWPDKASLWSDGLYKEDYCT